MENMEAAHTSLLNYAGTIFIAMLTIGVFSIIMSSLKSARAGYRDNAIKTAAKLFLFVPIVSTLSWISFNYDSVSNWIDAHIHINPIIAILICMVTYALMAGAIFGLLLSNFAKAVAEELKA